jgi:hypothetical protein
LVLLLGISGVFFAAAAEESHPAAVSPPDRYFRTVERELSGSTPLFLMHHKQAVFSIAAADPKDEVLGTAAADLARYFDERWGTRPAILSRPEDATGNLIVLASVASIGRLPAVYRHAALKSPGLAGQAFAIERVSLPHNRSALLCLGGSAIGARYAMVEILRRLAYDREEAEIRFDHLRDEPYSTWRAIYINDSAHQANNFNPNLVYPVDTYRWPMEKWKRYIDQMAFFRYNVLQIWLVPQMFSPKALAGGGVYDYVQNTLEAVAEYARPRGIQLCMTNGINVAVDSGTLLDTLAIYRSMPVYRYLSPNKPQEKALMLALWNHWSKALPGVSIWQLFPGDPGGCHEQGCGPETYVDLALEITHIIKKNNPRAIIDFCPWQFFGWGTSWPAQMRKDTARVDRGYRYLVSKLDEFPPDTIFSPNLNDSTSEPPVANAGAGGNTIEYIDAIHRKGHLIHTWSYFVTEGEGWLNHHDKVDDILRQRDIEARYPISGGICYTMTPGLNLLNQYACSEAFWNPQIGAQEIMKSFTDGVFGIGGEADQQKLIDIFPTFDVGPIVGYTFAKAPEWNPDYAQLHLQMELNRAILNSLHFSRPTRFDLIESAAAYRDDLASFADLYARTSRLGQAVHQARAVVKRLPEFHETPLPEIGISQAEEALQQMGKEDEADKRELEQALSTIQMLDVPVMKAHYRARHYQIFDDYPTDFTSLLPHLIDGFFDAFGADFLTQAPGQ